MFDPPSSIRNSIDAINNIVCAATCLVLMAGNDHSELNSEAVMWLAGEIVEMAESEKRRLKFLADDKAPTSRPA